MPYAPDDTLQPTIQWELNLFSEGLSFNRNTGAIEGSGHRLHFMPVTERIEMNDDDMYILPDGEYEIVPAPLDSDGGGVYKAPWTIEQGSEGETVWSKYMGFWYQEYKENTVTASAPIISGTVTVTKMEGFENSYVFEFDLLDDIGNRLTGTYSGSIGLNVNGRQLPD